MSLMRRFYAGPGTRFSVDDLEDTKIASTPDACEETIARGSCDPHILAVADELLPVA
jgi:hypothetical protein